MTRMVKRRSMQTNCRTFSMLASVVEVQGLPDFVSSSTSSLPFTNSLCHSKTFVLDMEESPQTSDNIFKIFVAVFPSLMQILILILCSSVILQLNSYRYKHLKKYCPISFFQQTIYQIHLRLRKSKHNSVVVSKQLLNREHMLCHAVKALTPGGYLYYAICEVNPVSF